MIQKKPSSLIQYFQVGVGTDRHGYAFQKYWNAENLTYDLQEWYLMTHCISIVIPPNQLEEA